MRMRRKKHLEERIASCGKYLLFTEGKDFYIKSDKEKQNVIDFEEVFGNNNPVYLEIGCGKGGFAFEHAAKYPQINFIAVEKIGNVIIEACEKAEIEKPENLRFLNISAENLLFYIKEASVDRIYLNFSCPYPKYTYRNRRLTYFRYLNIYKKILKFGGEIHLKTDSSLLFEFSIQSFSENGFKLKNVCLDLHSSDFKDNIQTEYESMFAAQGKLIHRLEAYL